MIHTSRLGTLTLIAGGILASAPFLRAAAADLRPTTSPSELLLSGPSQGYLGVGIKDVDSDRATALKLKEDRGAEIITIDQDAPALKAGLKVHDVVFQMNGQRIEGVEQFRRMLRETPPGRSVSLVVMRDGQSVNVSVELADRATLGKTVMVGINEDGLSGPNVSTATAPEVIVMPHGKSSGFLDPLFGRNNYYVGIEVQPLTSGLAEYFGVKNGAGLLVGNVFPNSPGAAAGLKAADVIQKVNGQPVVSLSDWERAIRANRGKQIQVTVIRDKKEQTLSMVAGAAKNSSELDSPEFVVPDPDTLAELQRSLAGIDAAAIDQQVKQAMAGIDTEALRQQAEQASKSIDIEALRKQAEQAVQSIDREQIEKDIEQSRQQADRYRNQIQEQMLDLRQSLQTLRLEEMD